jgi:Concanavalin A-like lectin/glucanases superfamily/Domain of unknown function (DUF2341)
MMKRWIVLVLVSVAPACSVSDSGTGPDPASGGASSTSSTGAGAPGVDCPPAVPGPPWWDTTFGRRIRISFKNAAGEELRDLPVLIRLTPERFQYGHAARAGTDLRFVDGDGSTLLSHEIELWSPGKESTLWVRVPRIDAASAEDHIWLYYDNPAAEGVEETAAVWRERYAGVYHFSQRTAGADPYRDSTGRYHGSLLEDEPDPLADGVVATAVQLKDGNGVDLGATAPLLAAAEPADARTVSAWFKTSTKGPEYRFIASQEANCKGWGIALRADGGIEGRFFTGETCAANAYAFSIAGSTGKDFADGAWHHVALVIDRPRQTLQLYIDGAPEGSKEITDMRSGEGEIHRIGAQWDADPLESFVGEIDEFRVALDTLSASWIRADLLSTGDEFATFGETTCR